ncbi:hypothetical protein ACFQPA_05045 [Halomarina halobia]|uniref:CHAT domain-containing protein n=1 Tax=Halomarina halobia TaxID=3033386 RepID=A0ABD6A622_9EURY|nr:hypothetical protein [Halomarina sp. PSR21]
MTFVAVEPLPAGDGVRITDSIERRQCDLATATSVEPRSVSPHRIALPVDAAAALTTSAVSLPQVVATYVRDPDGALVHEVTHFEDRTLPAGVYHVELSAPVKLYLRVEGPCTVHLDDGSTTIEFDREREVIVGARSYHERPAATITTTDDPEDVMTAISYLGSALKTTTCERSFPTLRGHPPAIELGDELSIPDGLSVPETGVTLELPPSLSAAFVAAPLAYYLGARVVPGDEPRLVTDDGFAYPLDGPDGYEREVERVLKHVFFLDCLVRTEGIYPVDLAERRIVERHLDADLDFAALYDRPLAEQLESYLSVPFEALAPHAPTWKQTAHVEPIPSGVEALPFLADDLAVIRTPAGHTPVATAASAESIEMFMRGEPVRGEAARTTGNAARPRLVRPAKTDSLEEVWVGTDAPVGATKASPTAFRNRLEQRPKSGDLSIVVVCNDESMLDEHDDARGVYGSRANLPFDVTVYRDLTTDRLRLVLESEIDYFHYIGHIEDGGFQCSDGLLDARTLDAVGMNAFFLNACASYEQGMALIDAGAIGGVATLDPVINTGATAVGRTMARLLNSGFTLRAALDVAREESVVGGQYLVVGDGNVDIAHAESLVPVLSTVESAGDRYEVTIRTYPTGSAGMGTTFTPAMKGYETCSLIPGELRTFSLTREEFEAFLSLDDSPVRLDGRLIWSSSLVLDD